MEEDVGARPVSAGARWTARVMATLGVLFLTFDAVIKVVRLDVVAQSAVELGLPVHQMFWIGVLEVILLLLYLVPRTAVLGALLWTGFLGGAILTQLRVEAPLFTHVLFPTYIAALLWVPLYLREPRLRTLLPLREA